jgi:RNA-binding protein YhbY
MYPFFFLAGRRGIFDGVIEEIHQHWKHKEIVKVITKQTRAYQITYTSMLLEVETGGMLIATQKLTNSQAIILYRGKNYRRPTKSEPSNLLTKREALRRSIEVQRRGVWIRMKLLICFSCQISISPSGVPYLSSFHLICSR